MWHPELFKTFFYEKVNALPRMPLAQAGFPSAPLACISCSVFKESQTGRHSLRQHPESFKKLSRRRHLLQLGTRPCCDKASLDCRDFLGGQAPKSKSCRKLESERYDLLWTEAEFWNPLAPGTVLPSSHPLTPPPPTGMGWGWGSGGMDAKDAGLIILWGGSVSGSISLGIAYLALVPLPITAAWPLVLFK